MTDVELMTKCVDDADELLYERENSFWELSAHKQNLSIIPIAIALFNFRTKKSKLIEAMKRWVFRWTILSRGGSK